MSEQATMAVIGGSGFYEIDGLEDVRRIEIETPFGAPSDAIVVGSLAGTRIAFLPRHGVGHRILPSEIPQRANIWALASLGVEHVLSVSAVGSLREEIAPMHMVVPDQLIDKTHGRIGTFFGRGIVGHISFDAPFCSRLSAAVAGAASSAGVSVHAGGTCVVMEGPAFSTLAESELHRSWGASIIGMTALPEAKLCREAGMCYATLACVTDYDTWHPAHDSVTVDMIVRNLQANVGNARRIVASVAGSLPERDCSCADALQSAIITPMHLVPEQVKRDLAPILNRVRTGVMA
jgi:5'-methylthioadenosine phosphorylase